MELPFYRQVLLEELRKRQQKNRRFSLRAFASRLNICASTLSQILSGKSTPSKKAALRICQELKLPMIEEERFLYSIFREKWNLARRKALMGTDWEN